MNETDANDPHLSVIGNLECQLNLLDKRIGVKSAYHGFPRWPVREDEQGLFINRNMIGPHEKDGKEYVPTRVMTRMPVISHLRAFCTMRYTRAIYIVAGHEGPDPANPNRGYVAKINLSGRFYKIEDVNM
nr:hypothetical protein [Tanacetum cinerariifolium]